MTTQHNHNLTLAASAREFLRAVPAAQHQPGKPTPIFFGQQTGMMEGGTSIMYLQFVGDGEWFSADAFTSEGAQFAINGGGGMNRAPGGGRFNGGGRGGFGGPGGGAGGGPGGGGPGGGFGGGGPGFGGRGNTQDNAADSPTLFDPLRIEFFKKLYANLSASDLAKKETDLLKTALSQGRPVYAVLPPGVASEFTNRLEREGFTCSTITTWREISPPVDDTDTAGGNFFGRGGMLNGMGGGGNVPGMPNGGQFFGGRNNNRRRGFGGPGESTTENAQIRVIQVTLTPTKSS